LSTSRITELLYSKCHYLLSVIDGSLTFDIIIVSLTILDLAEEPHVLIIPKWETDIKGLYWVIKKARS